MTSGARQGEALMPERVRSVPRQRETWEETSLVVSAGELVRIFDNGFHLFWCSSGLLSEPEIRRPLEIKATAFYPVSSFGTLNWRFPDQGDALAALIADRLETEANAK